MEADSSCDYDSLRVYGGADEHAPMLGEYCGSEIPAPILTTTNGARLWLTSDSSVDSSGFSVDYTAHEMICEWKSSF